MSNQYQDEENHCFQISCCHNPPCISDPNKEVDTDFRCRFMGYVFSGLVIAIVIIVTVTMSFWYVPYNYYALKRNTYSGVDLTKVYGEGRYFLYLTDSFVYFPSTYKEITYTTKTFAENGLEFDCYWTFYYKLPKENIGTIYDSFSTVYETRVINNALQITKNIASTFSVSNFLSNRTYIEKTIANSLQSYLYSTVQVYAPAEYFKIINIVFPATLMNKSLETAIALQNNQIQAYVQQVNIINADTGKMKAIIDAETVKTLEYANNMASQIITNSLSESTRILSLTRSKGINVVCDNLNITNPHDINRLTNVFAVMDNVNNYTMINTASAMKNGLLLNA